MKKYIVLLRGVNVSGKNKLPMVELRNLLKDLGFLHVQTYIQSGNIILESDKNKNEICEIIQDGIFREFRYNIPVISKSVVEWEKIILNYPFSIENEKIVAFTFLSKVSKEAKIEITNLGEDAYKMVKDVVYLYCPTGFGKTKITNNVLEKKLNVIATTRNFKTTVKLLELAK